MQGEKYLVKEEVYSTATKRSEVFDMERTNRVDGVVTRLEHKYRGPEEVVVVGD